MSLLNFVTGVGKIVGGLFGSGSKQTSSGTTNQYGSKTGSSSSDLVSAGTNKQEQTGTRDQTTTGKTNTTGSTATDQTTSMFSEDVLAQLDQLLTTQLGGGAQSEATGALRSRLSQLNDLAKEPTFNVDQYVQGVTGQARADTQMDLESSINSLLSSTGSSEQGNSMSALLGQRMRNTAAANLAGVESQAQLTGQQIAQAQQESRTGQIGQISGQISQDLANLIGASAGAQQTTTGTQTSQQTELQDILNKISESMKGSSAETATATKEEEYDEKSNTRGTSSQTIRDKPGWGKIFDNIAGLFGSSQAAA